LQEGSGTGFGSGGLFVIRFRGKLRWEGGLAAVPEIPSLTGKMPPQNRVIVAMTVKSEALFFRVAEACDL
jgi:hypothetical protein